MWPELKGVEIAVQIRLRCLGDGVINAALPELLTGKFTGITITHHTGDAV